MQVFTRTWEINDYKDKKMISTQANHYIIILATGPYDLDLVFF